MGFIDKRMEIKTGPIDCYHYYYLGGENVYQAFLSHVTRLTLRAPLTLWRLHKKKTPENDVCSAGYSTIDHICLTWVTLSSRAPDKPVTLRFHIKLKIINVGF